MWHTSWRVPNWSDSNRTSSCILFIWPFIWQKDVLMGIAFQDPDRKNRSYQRPWCLFPSSWLAAFCCGSHVHVHFSQVVDHMHACSRLRAFGSFSLARLVQHVHARLSLSLSDPYLSLVSPSFGRVSISRTAGLRRRHLRPCLDASMFQKFYKIPRHIKSLDACMKH
jgi:hypothetical protein